MMPRLGLLIIALIVAADQATKYWVLEHLRLSPEGCLEPGFGCGHVEVSETFFNLSMVWNRGVSFGLMRADSDFFRWALVATQFAVAGFFGWWLMRAANRLAGWGLALVVGGALGNVIDRIRFGAVADFIDFRSSRAVEFLTDWAQWNFVGLLDFQGQGFAWVFNIADASITIGAGLLILDFLRQAQAKQEATPAPPHKRPDHVGTS